MGTRPVPPAHRPGRPREHSGIRALIVAADHQNALVDPLLLGLLPRRLVPVAKAPRFRHPLIGPFLRLVGALPVHRRQEGGTDPARNRAMFAAATAHLGTGQAVLIFSGGCEPARAGADASPHRCGTGCCSRPKARQPQCGPRAGWPRLPRARNVPRGACVTSNRWRGRHRRLHRSPRDRSRRGYAPPDPSAHGGTPAADRRSRRPRDASLLRVVESISCDEAPSNARGFFRLLLDRDLRRRLAARRRSLVDELAALMRHVPETVLAGPQGPAR